MLNTEIFCLDRDFFNLQMFSPFKVWFLDSVLFVAKKIDFLK